jgi:hypothetical protein
VAAVCVTAGVGALVCVKLDHVENLALKARKVKTRFQQVARSYHTRARIAR